MDYSPLGSSVHGILQARKLEWVAISLPGDLLDSGIAGGLFTIRTTSEATGGMWARKIQRLLSTLSAGESAGIQG